MTDALTVVTLHWPPPAQPPLAADEVDLHWIDPAIAAQMPRRARSQALIDGVLAAYLPPATPLRYSREAHGKPFLALADAPDFNLSDTRGGSVIAVAGRPRIGVDLEREDRRPPALSLARRWFAAAEAEHLSRLDEPAAARAFLHLWTAKEASCKATGSGIFGWLDRWTFAPDNPRPDLQSLPADAGAAANWWHQRLAPWPGYTCVLAATPGPRRLRHVLHLSE